jgi:hypothetical protein
VDTEADDSLHRARTQPPEGLGAYGTMGATERWQYLTWWKRLGWWLLVWLCFVLVVACVVASPGEVFGDAAGLFTVAYLAFTYGR